ncbi:hypothetical protein HaLaN_22639, partial [Haematococcus lacustris]
VLRQLETYSREAAEMEAERTRYEEEERRKAKEKLELRRKDKAGRGWVASRGRGEGGTTQGMDGGWWGKSGFTSLGARPPPWTASMDALPRARFIFNAFHG